MPIQLLIDGHSMLFRAFHAMPELSNHQGVPTGALYGFSTMLLKVIADENPERVVVVFDSPEPTFRHQRYALYKATRQETPVSLETQLPLVKRLLEALEIPHLALPGYEADDILGTLAVMGPDRGYHSLIVTGDRDLLQLVNADVTVLLASRLGVSELERMDAAGVERKLGVVPERVPDLKGLMGDSSDNIPGVAGIGQKSAVALVLQYGSIENIYRHVGELATKRWKTALEGQREVALESKQLATIDATAPVSWPEMSEPYQIPHTESLRQFLAEMELNALNRRIFGAEAAPAAQSTRETVAAMPEVPSEALDWTKPAVNVVLPEGPPYFFGQVEGGAAPWADLPLPDVTWTGWEIKSLLRKGLERRCRVPRFADDGALQAYLLNSESGRYDLDSQAAQWGLEVPQTPWQRLAVVGELVRRQSAALRSMGLENLYQDVEMPLTRVLVAMEVEGITVNRPRLQALGEELEIQMQHLQTEIYALSGESFNINSPQQLGAILFDKLQLPTLRKTKTGYSTDADTLEALAPRHPMVAKVLEYRQLVKIKGTYVDGLLPLVGDDGKLHTTFHQTVAATGRLSSSDPNLQNIPVRLPLGRRVREVFGPSPGRVLLAADYSQIELRMLAHLAADEQLLEAFQQGEDIHRRTAAEMFGMAWEDVDATWRGRAKAVNFGIIYGISDFGLARDTGVSRAEAGEYIQRYFARYPRIREYFDRVIADAKRQGYVTTILGRRRPLPDIAAHNRARRQYAERMAMNTVVQGSAADLIKMAMVAIYQQMADEGLESRLILQVHDELIWDMVPDEKQRLMQIAESHMTSVLSLAVPLVVEFKEGGSWGHLTPTKITREARGHAGTSRS